MEFCANCGTRLVLDQKVSNENEAILVCPKCDYRLKAAKEESLLRRAVNSSPEEQVAVIGEEEARIRTMSTTKAECPKCANKKSGSSPEKSTRISNFLMMAPHTLFLMLLIHCGDRSINRKIAASS